jgi:hypothetical protein
LSVRVTTTAPVTTDTGRDHRRNLTDVRPRDYDDDFDDEFDFDVYDDEPIHGHVGRQQ